MVNGAVVVVGATVVSVWDAGRSLPPTLMEQAPRLTEATSRPSTFASIENHRPLPLPGRGRCTVTPPPCHTETVQRTGALRALLVLLFTYGCIHSTGPRVSSAPPEPARSTTSISGSATSPSSATPTSTYTPPPTTVSQSGRYTFPVSPASGVSYGHSHHDYPATDIFVACGTPVVAVTDGVVQEVSRTDSWDPRVDDGATRGGLSTSVVGDDGTRYYGSHLATLAKGVAPGLRVVPGLPLGTVGSTGSARGTGCHLHFGLSPPCGPGDWQVRRGTVYPWPYLDSWRAGGQRSPSDAVRAWRTSHPC